MESQLTNAKEYEIVSLIARLTEVEGMNGLHIHEDIINFSASDNVWCAVYERAVKEYVKKSHNGKYIEATFAHVESIREYSKSVEEKEQTSLGKHDVLLVSLQLLTNSHNPQIFVNKIT